MLQDLRRRLDTGIQCRIPGCTRNDGKKVDCSVIERYSNDCEYCVNAGKDLFSDGFSNSSDKFPEEYNTPYTKAQELLKKAKTLLETAKSKSLCN